MGSAHDKTGRGLDPGACSASSRSEVHGQNTNTYTPYATKTLLSEPRSKSGAFFGRNRQNGDEDEALCLQSWTPRTGTVKRVCAEPRYLLQLKVRELESNKIPSKSQMAVVEDCFSQVSPYAAYNPAHPCLLG
jgi:hypothetical protein